MEKKVKWISRIDYVTPWIKAAKNRDIKLSNKNLKKLDDCHGTWASKHFGLNGLFRHCYEEHIKIIAQKRNPFLDIFKTAPPDYNITTPINLDNSKKE